MLEKTWGFIKSVCGCVKKAVTTCVASFVIGTSPVTGKAVAVAAAMVVTSSVVVTEYVYAGVDFTDVTISTADIFTFAGIILAAIGAIWGIKKLIGMGNKS